MIRMANLYTRDDLAVQEYQHERGGRAELPEFSPRQQDSLVLQSVRRDGESLGDIGNLRGHLGMADEDCWQLVGAFELSEVDRSGIRTVLPISEYRPLLAAVENSR